MELFYLAIVIIIMLFAVLDLMVGVANDAANFLNSAVGSKAAPRKIIMIVASLGIMVGVLTTSGMMEIARSGVFHPGMFNFSTIMLLFLAVMLTDVILLDVFNSVGLPTSTTVSLVFELLGAAVCIALFSIMASPDSTLADLSHYINTGKALAIIAGILISIVIALVCGTAVMYVTRIIFTFNFKSKIKSIGSVWCGFALTAITYFALFKGLEKATIVPGDLMTYINNNMMFCLSVTLVFWSALMFLFSMLKINTLRITVLAGTFALALAFAGNDLVNFIGVFMASYDSYHLAVASGDMTMSMGELTKPVQANMWILLASGTIMALTLWFSRKARKVTNTEVNLARQDSGAERFGSTLLSRTLVRSTLNANKYISRRIPASVKKFIEKRFQPATETGLPDAPSFDLIRATVNLTIAALLISMATSLKLPLSTTYVTFMVAMGSSLADRAWGRESAVYRITGVLTVISGWFITAIVAFVMSFLVAALLMWAGIYAVIILAILCAYRMVHSNLIKKEKAGEVEEEHLLSTLSQCEIETTEFTKTITELYNSTLNGVFAEDRKQLKNTLIESREVYRKTSERKYGVLPTLNMLKDSNIESGHYYVQVVDYLNEMSKSLLHTIKACFEHVDNNHSAPSIEQIADLKNIITKMNIIFEKANAMLVSCNFTEFDHLILLGDNLFDDFAQATKNQIYRNRDKLNTTRTSVLYLEILAEAKILILQLRNFLKARKNFFECK